MFTLPPPSSFLHSSAQLLEPFRIHHDIQLLSGSAMMPGGGGIGELDRAPGAPTSMMHQNLVLRSTTELEDPPGLYEKVGRWARGKFLICSCF